MGQDINIIWEIKEGNNWIALGERNDSVLVNNFMGLVLNGQHICGWYRDEEVHAIHQLKKGCPKDLSSNIEDNIEDYFTKDELENFNWDNIIVPYDVAVRKEDYILYKNGTDPLSLSFATCMSGESFRIEFDLLFKDHFPEIIKELEDMKKYKDYRLLVYYE